MEYHFSLSHTKRGEIFRNVSATRQDKLRQTGSNYFHKPGGKRSLAGQLISARVGWIKRETGFAPLVDQQLRIKINGKQYVRQRVVALTHLPATTAIKRP